MRKAYLMNIKDLPVGEALLLVPAWRREKAERLRFEKDKKRSLGAWLLLMYALKKEGLSCGEIAFGERGKPYFTDETLPRFCLSHSGEYALCAVADEEVGCDVQEMVTPSPSLIGRVCTDREKELFLTSPMVKLPSDSETDEAVPTSSAVGGRHLPRRGRQEETDILFTSLWAKKESLLKLSGLGMAADLTKTEASSGPCFFLDGHAVYACTENGGFPQETAVVSLNEVLSLLKI